MRSLALLALLTGCTCGADGAPDAAPSPVPVPAPAPVPDRPPPANPIRTEPLSPATHRVRAEDLPPPQVGGDEVHQSPEIADIPDDPVLRVPAGFQVNVFASDLEQPRWLRLTPDGDVLVTETRENRITILSDRDHDGAAELREVFADDDAGNTLDIPFGMTFTPDAFYLGNHDEVRRWPFARGQRRLEGAGERITTLPGGGYHQHWTRNVLLAPDGEHLYVTIGSASNDDPEPEPRATVQVMRLDGSERRTFASGVRNPVGLAFHPRTGQLWATVVERDGLGDDLVPDYLVALRDGGFYGWPWVYVSPAFPNPHLARRRAPDRVAETISPDVMFQAHSTPLGIAICDRPDWPEHYRSGAFVAFRGSWNRRLGTGYGIVFVPFDAEGRAVGTYEDFLLGFLLDPAVPSVWGRPVGVLCGADGSLLFTEESNGRIYRVSTTSDPR